jgi:hypothetical protein
MNYLTAHPQNATTYAMQNPASTPTCFQAENGCVYLQQGKNAVALNISDLFILGYELLTILDGKKYETFYNCAD